MIRSRLNAPDARHQWALRRGLLIFVNSLVLLWFCRLVALSASARNQPFNLMRAVTRWGLVDWLYFFVPFVGLLGAVCNLRIAAVLSASLYCLVFAYFFVCLILAMFGILGFSEPEHVGLFVIGRGLPALLIGFALLIMARFTGGVLPARPAWRRAA